MTEQELSKYAGKKTFGKNNEILTNGIVVGYDPDDNEQCLVARFENGDVNKRGWSKQPYKIKFFTKEEEEIYNSGKGCYLFARIGNVIMEEELDLTKILEGCEGVELWSDICGKCKLESLVGGGYYEIEVLVLDTIDGDNGYEQFTKYGRLYWCYPNGKCMLWPSETNRDWSTFKKPIKEGIPCMCKNSDSDIWVLITERQASYTYCVPVENFDFKDIESNISRSIV